MPRSLATLRGMKRAGARWTGVSQHALHYLPSLAGAAAAFTLPLPAELTTQGRELLLHGKCPTNPRHPATARPEREHCSPLLACQRQTHGLPQRASAISGLSLCPCLCLFLCPCPSSPRFRKPSESRVAKATTLHVGSWPKGRPTRHAWSFCRFACFASSVKKPFSNIPEACALVGL